MCYASEMRIFQQNHYLIPSPLYSGGEGEG